MQRLRERARKVVAPERVAYFRDRGLEQAVETVEVVAGAAAVDAGQALLDAAAADGRVDDVLAGTEVFSAVNVGGTDVKPFLDKTDGAKLTDATALDAGVVDTAALSTTAIRPGAPATNAAQVLIKGLNLTGGSTSDPGASTLLTTSFDVLVTGTVIIRFTATLTSTNAETLEAALFVDFAGTNNMDTIRAVEASDPTRYRFVEQNDPAGDTGSIQIVTTASLTAGTHSVTVLGMALLNNDEFLIEAGGASLEVFVR